MKPVIVNVGRAGAANLDVIQEVEYVKDDVKIPYLLQCLQKTAPPVIIFCERKGDVGKSLIWKKVLSLCSNGYLIHHALFYLSSFLGRLLF